MQKTSNVCYSLHVQIPRKRRLRFDHGQGNYVGSAAALCI